MALKDSVLQIVIKAKDLATKALEKFQTGLKKTDETSKKAESSTSKLTGKLDQFRGQLNKVNETSKKAETSTSKLTKKIGNFRSELTNAGEASKKAESTISNLTKRLVALASAAVGIRTLTGFVKSFLSTGDKFERLDKQLESVMGSLAGGKKATEWIKDFTSDTPLQLEQVGAVFSKLKAFGIDPMNGSLQALVDQNAALGGSYEKLSGISLAVGQAWAKQKLQGEEILQLIERGVPVWELLEEVTGKNAQQLQKMSAAGEIGRDTIQKLVLAMGERNLGAASRQMELMSGYVSNLKDEWQLFLNEIAQSGALDYVKSELKDLLATVQQMRNSGELKALAKSISDTFISVGESIKGVVVFIKDHSSNLSLLTKVYAALKLGQYANQFRAVANSLFQTSTATRTVTVATLAAEKATRLLGAAMRAIPWLFLIQQSLAIADNISKLVTANSQLKKSQSELQATQEKAADQLRAINHELGLNVETQDELIALQESGVIVWDQLAGKMRLASDAMSAVEIAQNKQIAADKQAAAEKEALGLAYDSLKSKFSETITAGKGVTEAIKEMAEQARNGGEQGIAALSIGLQRLVVDGTATEEQIRNGLGAFLESLSSDQYNQFGDVLQAEFASVSTASDKTSNRVSFLARLLNTDLSESARRAGVDISKIFTGVDEESNAAIASFSALGQKLVEVGSQSSDSDKIIKAGLLETIKSLDSEQEIQATIDAVKLMEEQHVISAGAAQDAYKLLRETMNGIGADTKKNADDLTKANDGAQLSTAKLIETQKISTDEINRTNLALGNYQQALIIIGGMVEKLGEKSQAAFTQLQQRTYGIVSGISTLASAAKTEFSELDKQISDSMQVISDYRINMAGAFSAAARAVIQTGKNAAVVTVEFAKQKLGVEKLKAAYEEGKISAAAFTSRAQGALKTSSLLGQEDLSGLRGALRAASNEMQALQDQAASTLSGLQQELATLKGDQLELLQLQQQQKVAQLDAQLQAASASGNQQAIEDAKQSLALAKEIYSIKKRDAVEQERQSKSRESEVKAAVSRPNFSEKTQSTQKTETIKTVSVVINGRPVEVLARDEAGLLDILSEFGAITE